MENKGSEDDIPQGTSFIADKDTFMNFVSDVNFHNEVPQVDRMTERKRKRQEKQLADEKYLLELQEQQYKRLMHLLNRSKFYSTYILNKINGNLEPTKHNGVKRDKKMSTFMVENVSPPENGKKKKRNVQNYISEDVTKRIKSKSQKLNLNEEDVNDLGKSSTLDTKANNDILMEVSKYFNGSLREYQMEGLQWLKVLYEHGINGILGDEMGLGKTIQVIALLCHLIEKCQDGPYLIIVPLSTAPNWMIEFEKFAPKLPVILFHGMSDERLRLKSEIKQKYKITETYSTLPIVITTYETPLYEPTFMKSLKWRYIIVDEGHRIKNHNCQLIQLLKNCKSMNRLLLTGTPLQNNLAELWSLLNFLLPEIFNDLAVFESWFDAKEFQNNNGTNKFLKLEEEKRILSSLREILQPFMLRREKVDVCLDIPAKKELVVYVPLTQLQYDLYKAILNYDLDRLKKIEETPIIYSKDGLRPKRRCVLKNINYNLSQRSRNETLGNTSLPISNADLSLQESDQSEENNIWKENKIHKEYQVDINLRNRFSMYKRVVNHPYLIHYPLTPYGTLEIDENIVKASGKLLVLDALLEKLKKRGHKVLLFSTMVMILDVIEDYLSIRPYKYTRLDGGTKLVTRKENIQTFNTDPDVFLFLISTRAGGVGLNLVGADTVIIYDSDWNPQADIQAMARCHRIGQNKPVVIYKLCTKGTIDEAILNRANVKRTLEKVVISKAAKNLNLDNPASLLELKRLLESKDCQIVQSESQVFTEEEFNKLLDRSDLCADNEKSETR